MQLDSEELLKRYQSGERNFKGLRLLGSQRRNQDGYIDLSGVDLSQANLEDAELRNILLLYASLSGATLKNSYLENTGLIDADLSKTDLSGVTFVECGMDRANLRNANLSQAKFYENTCMGADLTNANLSNAELISVYFCWANLSKASFHNATLAMGDVYLENTNLQDADFTGAKDNDGELFIFAPHLKISPIKLIDLKYVGANEFTGDGAIFCRTIMPDGSICNDRCGEPWLVNDSYPLVQSTSLQP